MGSPECTVSFPMQQFEKLDLSLKPMHRTFATLCPLIDPEVVGESLCPGGPPVEQNLLMLWGKKTDNSIVEDCWLFSVGDRQWRKVKGPSLVGDL